MNAKRGILLNEVIFSFSCPFRDEMLVENVSPVARPSPIKDVIGGKILRPFRTLGCESIHLSTNILSQWDKKSEYQHLLKIPLRFYEH